MWKVAGSRSNRIATLIGSFSLGIANLAIGLSPSPRAWQLSGKDIETNCVHLFARPLADRPLKQEPLARCFVTLVTWSPFSMPYRDPWITVNVKPVGIADMRRLRASDYTDACHPIQRVDNCPNICIETARSGANSEGNNLQMMRTYQA